MEGFTPGEVLRGIIDGLNVLMVSFRLNHEKKDGVSLEVLKWAEVLHECGANVHYYSGETKIPPGGFVAKGRTFERVHFLSDDIMTEREKIFSRGFFRWDDLRKIVEDEQLIRSDLAEYICMNDIDVVIAENILAYPGNIALSLATVNVCNDFGVKVLAHNHDHWFERKRFKDKTTSGLRNLLNEILRKVELLYTLTINKTQVEKLKEIGGFKAEPSVVPNIMNFEKSIKVDTNRTAAFRKEFHVPENALLVLLPVRPVPRKELHLALEICRTIKTKYPDLCAMVTHPAGDEGLEYWDSVVSFAKECDVQFIYKPDDEKYSLEDCYHACDVVLYTSSLEGFGNALIEAVYFKKLVIINPYEVFVKDIKPAGIKCVEVKTRKMQRGEYLVDTLLKGSEEKLMKDIEMFMGNEKEIVEHNYGVGEKNFSYQTLRVLLVKAFLKLMKQERETRAVSVNHSSQGEKEILSREKKKAFSNGKYVLNQRLINLTELKKMKDASKSDEMGNQYSPFEFYEYVFHQTQTGKKNGVTMKEIVANNPDINHSEIDRDLGILIFLGFLQREEVNGQWYYNVIADQKLSSLPEDLLIKEFKRKRSKREIKQAKTFMRKKLILEKFSNGDIDWHQLSHSKTKYLVSHVARKCLNKKISDLIVEDFDRKFVEFNNQSLKGLLEFLAKAGNAESPIEEKVKYCKNYLMKDMDLKERQNVLKHIYFNNKGK